MSNERAANTLVTLGFLGAEGAEQALATLEGGTWPGVLESMGLKGDELEQALAIVAAAAGPLGDDAVTAESEDRYLPIVELGQGGMGRVVRAEDSHLHREVARKELLVNHPAIELRFLREARITAQLEHPGIIPVYELGRRADGTLYYTMKEVRGRTLREALDEAPNLVDRLALLGVFVDLCQAVGYAHSKGVVHRDLKPENVMIGAFGETTVLDWGLAKIAGEPDAALPEGVHVGSGGGSDLTRAGTVMGTPKYMSPEQASGRSDLDARSDVWSIGVMLYELLSGEVPFAGSADSILRQVQDGLFAPVEQMVGGCPPALAAICNKALGFSPAERYDTAAEVAEELEAWRTGATVGAHTYSPMEQMRSAATRFRPVLVGGFGILLGGLVMTWVIGVQRDSAEAAVASERLRSAYLEEIFRAQRAAEWRPWEALALFRHALARPGISDADRGLGEKALPFVRSGNIRALTEEPAGNFAWTPSGERLAWARGRSVAVVDPDSGSGLGELPAPGIVTTFGFTDDESAIWIGTAEGAVVKMSLLDRSEKARIEVGSSVRQVLPSPAGERILVRPDRLDAGFGLWSSDGASLPLPLELSEAPSLGWDGDSVVALPIAVNALAVPLPNVQRDGGVVSGGTALKTGPNEVRLGDGSVLYVPGAVERLAVDPGGEHLAVGTTAGLYLWRLSPRKEVESNFRVCEDGRVVPVLPFPRVDDLDAPSRSCE